MKIALSDLATLVGGTVLCGDPAGQITGFASLKEAIAGDLSFFYDPRYNERLVNTHASAVLVPLGWTEFPPNASCIAVADPSRSFEQIVETYGFQPAPFAPGVHASAVVADGVKFDPQRVSIGANAVIESGVVLGDEVEIGPGCFVGRNVVIGKGSRLHANSTLHAGSILGEGVFIHSGTVIGADGFGYEFDGGRHRKVRQAGIVQIDNDVEIGAGCTVDRARFGRTWIGEGTKIDNLVQIGHNVVIGKHCIVVACTAIAGSATIGDFVVIAAQVGIAGHVHVGSKSTLAARCGVTRDLEGGQTYLGFPAIPAGEEKRRLASINRLPQLQARVKELEAQIAANGAS
ncbi:UDP-3-O-(3-hydroxymyristoyl)glucosamine N-acyltransferase [Prosthecobacter sp.]|uniref:UDP-3-O-(3-hydroxymyristoyl)glucosamine N-acyltransferase n=1 Tax=Prosthecobacter sp. TaxID=1965333 RepID=UPI002487A8EC|nr:UDP-3-O-(3-hydroxymyristoyl)glucosamine N-acyltransferase [Prosthecobacter sp.]MDI1315589.1 UDP-3-O-(3-hydroxymyristoyl)glucosamine N-acyltransferase [Prosthecobacter sp.]